MSNPIQEPTLYDYITLSGTRSPGLCVLEGGGDRSQKWDSQQAPGFAGAITIFKGEEIGEVSYQFILWKVEHFKAWDDFAAMLRAGTKKRPPRVYDLSDPAVSHNEIKAVAVASVGAMKKIGPSKWGPVVKFTEYRKPKPTGGPIKPAQTAQEKENEALNTENKALDKQLAAMQAAKAAGK